MNTLKKIKFVTLIVGLSTILTGCWDVEGGGWIYSSAGPTDKATFGFDMSCNQETEIASGSITYHDHGVTVDEYNGNYRGKKANKLAIQGIISQGIAKEATSFTGCNTTSFYSGYQGTYTPIPASVGSGGSFRVFVTDGGEIGHDKNDTLEIIIDTGVFAGYENAQLLMGGNITMPK